MATWHQQRAFRGNPRLLLALYAPHETAWKVVDNRHDKPASVLHLDSSEAAEQYVKNVGHGTIIPPKEKHRART